MTAKPKILAVIPARGGSKGIPGKNLALVGGKPLVAHAIATALLSTLVDRVVVSTDHPEIATVSRSFGAEVIERPAEISGDAASSETALVHALEHLRRTEDYRPDLLVFLQCTSPLTLPEDVDGTILALLDQQADTALAVSPFHYFLWQEHPSEGAAGINHDKLHRLRRQDRDKEYVETGAVYVMRAPGFLERGHRFFGKTALYVMPAMRRLEIDEPDDLILAEALYRRQRPDIVSAAFPETPGALVLDFDGVFTDNRVLVFQDGAEAVICHRGDGAGLSELKKSGLPILVLSAEKNPVVSARCLKLGLECRQALGDKRQALSDWLRDRGLEPESIIYLGNDVNDLGCMELAGCPVAVADAHDEVKKKARIVLSAPGGRGAIRELIDLIFATRGEEKNGEIS